MFLPLHRRQVDDGMVHGLSRRGKPDRSSDDPMAWVEDCSNIPVRYDAVAKYGTTVLILCLQDSFHQYDVRLKDHCQQQMQGRGSKGLDPLAQVRSVLQIADNLALTQISMHADIKCTLMTHQGSLGN